MDSAIGYIIGGVLALVLCIVLHQVDKNIWSKQKKQNEEESERDPSYFLECLADPWIFMTIKQFVSDVSDHYLTDYDGCCCGVVVDKKTLRLSEITIDLEDFDRSKHKEIEIDDFVESLIKKYSTDKYQFFAVEWFNK